jgi:hypothetical protein
MKDDKRKNQKAKRTSISSEIDLRSRIENQTIDWSFGPNEYAAELKEIAQTLYESRHPEDFCPAYKAEYEATAHFIFDRKRLLATLATVDPLLEDKLYSTITNNAGKLNSAISQNMRLLGLASSQRASSNGVKSRARTDSKDAHARSVRQAGKKSLLAPVDNYLLNA